MDAALRAALDDELHAIRADPLGAVGFGEKAYLPYSTVLGRGLVNTPDPAVTTMVADAIGAAADAGDRVAALALLHVLGQRSDDGVDPALERALQRPELRATAAYLLGRAGYRGYPDRRRDVGQVIAALRRQVADDAAFTDPFLGRTFQRRDFVLAALVRLLGVERFDGVDGRAAPMVGLALPAFTDDQRVDLTVQVTTLR